MKINFPLILLFFLISFSCSEESGEPQEPITPPVSANSIMPLGASRVDGARPIYESYRYELWKDLIDGDWDVDFVGTRDDEAEYPRYANQDFDIDHEGRGGWTSAQIRSGLNQWISEAGAPDIVLFSSPGGNDALQNLSYTAALENINAIIDILQAANPNVTIVIEQMAPGRSDFMTPQLTEYFNQLQGDVVTIASQQSTSSSPVLVVDMFTGFSDALLADDVHYNQAGAEFIAERYYQVLQNVLVP